jgi:serine/threonine protein kinase
MENWTPQRTHYRVQQLLGEGLNSNVYKALRLTKDSRFSEVVALKVLKSEISDEIWRKEINSLQRVHHPNCVRYLGFEVFPMGPAIVLELVDGVSLYHLQRSTPLSHIEVKEICQQVSQGLVALKKEGICHGDLSLENILMDRSGRIRLIDYGLANNSLASTRYFCRRWAAPEVEKGEKQSFLSDLYSLGLIGEKLLNGSNAQFLKPLLRPVAKHRKIPKYWREDKLARASLAKKVNWLLDIPIEKAQTSQMSPTPRRNLNISLKALSWFLLGLVSLVFFGSQKGTVLKQSARVSVRTQQWLKFRLDDGPWVDSPSPPLLLLPGQHRLEWLGAGGSGERALTVKAGQHIFINDNFFRDSH